MERADDRGRSDTFRFTREHVFRRVLMIETFYGVSFLGVGILIDQLGTYMIFFRALGIIVAAAFSTT